MSKKAFATKDYQKSLHMQKNVLWVIAIVALAIALITFPNFIQTIMAELEPDAEKQPRYGLTIFWAFVCAAELVSLLFVPLWAGFLGWIVGRGRVYRKNATYADVQGIIYYRDFLKGVSPALMSILMDMRVEDRKDVSATLLRMYNKGIIGVEGDNMICHQHKTTMSTDEQELYDMILSGGITYQSALEWKQNRLRDAIENGYIKSDPIDRIDYNNKGCVFGCWGMVALFGLLIVIIIAISGGIEAFSNDEDNDFKKVLAICAYYFISVLEPLDKAVTWLESLPIPLVSTYDWSINYDVPSSIGIFSSLSELTTVLWKSAVILGVFFILYGYPLFVFMYLWGYDLVKMKTQFVRTKKGNELAEKIAGLQRFISDFSTLSERQKEEVLLWDDFLVYAVALEENAVIPNDVVTRFQRYLSGLYASETAHAANFHMQFDVHRDKSDTVKQPWKR